ncbi:hypothetical protein RERY_02900 [Rhodococcus erythropolis]|nr:hypothetical protein RERY_02900 [Rhodococcus erythropolis]
MHVAVVTGWASEVLERRDTALLLMGYTGAFRRGEIVALECCDVRRDRLDGAHVRIRASKTDPDGVGAVKPYRSPAATNPARSARGYVGCRASLRSTPAAASPSSDCSLTQQTSILMSAGELYLRPTDDRHCFNLFARTATFPTQPSVVESNWKSIAHTTFGASASVIGVVEAPARLHILRTFTRSPSSRQSR